MNRVEKVHKLTQLLDGALPKQENVVNETAEKVFIDEFGMGFTGLEYEFFKASHEQVGKCGRDTGAHGSPEHLPEEFAVKSKNVECED